MKIVIIYASKTGTTKKCAELLSQYLGGIDIINVQTEAIDISKYDLVIIGSSIRMGQIDKKIKKLIKENRDILKTKLTAYYICCGFKDDYKTYFESNIPNELLESAIIYDTFGGEMDISKQKGFDKFIVNMISKTDKGKEEIKLMDSNIIKFSEKIKEIK